MFDLIVQGYPYGLGEDVLVLFHNLINLLLLRGGTLSRGHGCGHDLPLTLRVNHKENKFPSLGDYLNAFLISDQINHDMWGYFWYLV